MFEDASDRKRKMLALDYNPCPHCGDNPEKENAVVWLGVNRVAGCCKAAVAQVAPRVDPSHITEFSIKL